MTEQPEPEQQLDDEELPGTVPALEPSTLPGHPLRAQDVQALIPKEIG